ncbi:MAG: UDP-2,3-diacylglucosamine diphosphatase [Cyclobacteriaceae bacterium]|jgi:UDP-2,3-diacylglucosamine hydrolase|nr:UDP-2,3-diacylglucosamine diphosphatase [Cyclobacteriaceae bacterium]
MTIDIPELSNKKIYFASDFHLGVPDAVSSKAREKRIVRWLDSIKDDAHSIYLMGDIFDFWFEYKYAIPKGFIRLQGKLAELQDAGIPIAFFTGNHDMWMFNYFPDELGITVYKDPVILTCHDQRLMIGHGDGLGPGDASYKILKQIFRNPFCQWLFARLHPNLGIGLANYWSRKSRISNTKREEVFQGEENEYLFSYCKSMENTTHHDFYIFGHRHLPLDLSVGNNSRYINLGEWVHFNTYAEYDGVTVRLKTFKE